jgi:hypothetical protein
LQEDGSKLALMDVSLLMNICGSVHGEGYTDINIFSARENSKWKRQFIQEIS